MVGHGIFNRCKIFSAVLHMYELRKESKHWRLNDGFMMSLHKCQVGRTEKMVLDPVATRNQTTATGFTLQSSALATKPQKPTDRSMQTKHHI